MRFTVETYYGNKKEHTQYTDKQNIIPSMSYTVCHFLTSFLSYVRASGFLFKYLIFQTISYTAFYLLAPSIKRYNIPEFVCPKIQNSISLDFIIASLQMFHRLVNGYLKAEMSLSIFLKKNYGP